MSDADAPDHGADDLLRRALIDAEASAAVALSVGGLPVSEEVTVIFHGRRDLGDDPDLRRARPPRRGGVGRRGRAAARPVRPRSRRGRGPRRGRAPVRRAGARDARRARGRRHRARGVARAARPTSPAATSPSSARSSSTSSCPPTGCCRSRWWRPSAGWWSRRCAARARWPTAGRRWGSPAPSRTSRASTRCRMTRSAAWRTSSPWRPSHAQRLAEALEHREASVERFLELNGDE